MGSPRINHDIVSPLFENALCNLPDAVRNSLKESHEMLATRGDVDTSILNILTLKEPYQCDIPCPGNTKEEAVEFVLDYLEKIEKADIPASVSLRQSPENPGQWEMHWEFSSKEEQLLQMQQVQELQAAGYV